MKRKTTEEKPMDTIAVINEEVGRLKGLEEMRVQKATTRVEVAKADLAPTVREAQRGLKMLEACEAKYRTMIDNIEERKLTETFGGDWAQRVDRAVNELSVSLNIHARQLRQAVGLIENLSSLDLDVNRPHEIRDIVKRSDGAESRIEALVGQIKQGLIILSKQKPPENGTRVSSDSNLGPATTEIKVMDEKSGEMVTMVVSKKSPRLKIVNEFDVFERK